MNLSQSAQERLQSLVPRGSSVLCAVSGGPDSVALAHVMRGLPYTIVLGHVDHQMRVHSASDALFVQALAKKWDLPFKRARVAVPSYAAAHKISPEEAARDLRYKSLLKMAKKAGCSVIVTAHTADDQAETVLMNFMRGAGPAGLAGIPPARPLANGIQVVRPWLAVSRSDILAYLRSHRLRYREDPSNRSLRFTRNRIRKRVLPYLEKEYPGLKNRLVQTSEIFRGEQALWTGKVQREFSKTVRQNSKSTTVDLPRLLGYHRALGRRILRHLLTGISFQDTERVFQLAHCENGHLPIQLSGGLRVERKGDALIIRKRERRPDSVERYGRKQQ